MTVFGDRERDDREAADDAEQAGTDRLEDDMRRVPLIPEGGQDGSARSEREANGLVDAYERDHPETRLHHAGAEAPSNKPFPAADAGPRAVTAVELDLLRCLSRGMTVPMAAEALGKSVHTLKSQMQTVKPKLRAKTDTHACCNAIRQGLIP